MKRKIEAELLEWKQSSKGKTALLIDGARRVGKTYVAKAFGQKEYKSCLCIDFSYPRPGTLDCFENDSYDLDLFYSKLMAIYGVSLFKRESLVIFDEVQLYPKARQLIKHLVADGRYDFLETGSLISLKSNVKDILIPSEEQHLEMFPMDFEEFLWAMGQETVFDFLRELFCKMEPLGQAMHRRMLNEYRKYLLVGGMPQAVLEYAESRDFGLAEKVKKRILDLYLADIDKYAGSQVENVQAILRHLPGQLSKKEKKYCLADIDESARTREYMAAFVWLEKAMIVNTCYNATDPKVGLALSLDHATRKCYMGDTGLLVTQILRDDEYAGSELYKAILLDKIGINEGMIMENAVAQTLRTKRRSLFFYSRTGRENSADSLEIDFLISNHHRISPLEVKSNAYRKHSYLDKFRQKFAGELGPCYIVYQKDLMVKDEVRHVPLYLCGLI